MDLRYAAAMLERLFTLADLPLGSPRAPAQRLVGCCRDYTVLYLSIARHHGVAARARIGFATYFAAGWNIDHELVEAWDTREHRWRRIDAQITDRHRDPSDDTGITPLDVPEDRFIPASRAWLDARAGRADPASFIASPQLDAPRTRGWPYLVHNLVDELAALNQHEMLRWDWWGIMTDSTEAPSGYLPHLDQAAETMLNPDATREALTALYDLPGFRVPTVVMSASPAAAAPHRATLGRR